MKKILVTGGAGYIGSHAIFLLAKSGYEVVLYDNFSKGYKECAEFLRNTFPETVSIEEGDISSKENLNRVFEKHDIESVMHFAAFCNVNEASEKPGLYYRNNVMGTLNLVETMLEQNIRKIIFSSTSAVYSDDESPMAVDETHEVKPLNAYGASKYLTEVMLEDFRMNKGLEYIALRYFNVCGAEDTGLIGDSKKPSLLLMQNAVRGALGIEPFKFLCPEVPTPDGTPIRDYINVMDLADGHIMALEYLDRSHNSNIFNLGTGTGYSVKEIVSKVEEVTGKPIEKLKGETRKGDSIARFASIEKAERVLGWKPTHSLENSITSLVSWYTSHPHGWSY